MRAVFVLSGPIGVGKSEFARALARSYAVHRFSTRNHLLTREGVPNERGPLQEAGRRLDRETGGAWVADAAKEAAERCPAEAILLLDSARIPGQVEALRKAFPEKVLHIHLVAGDEILKARYAARPPDVLEHATYDEARADPTEAAVGALRTISDLTLQTDFAAADELALVALAFANIRPCSPCERLVDVFVGGQYGSEGKGNICSFLARHYDVLVRIGGPNAGHKAPQPPYKYVQLPSGTGANPYAKIIVAAGSTISLSQILLEIGDWKLEPSRLSIDPQAMIIDDEDRRIESGALGSIGSTTQGVGSATARKIMGRGKAQVFGNPVVLARDVDQLSGFVRDTKEELEKAFDQRLRVMLEGTQGTSLSIHHGRYPYVTSRETTASGCLADAGIAPHRVRRVVMVTRTYPIRVGGTSGPMGTEIDFSVISTRSGISLDELHGIEKGTISGTQRRVAEFDWMQLRQSSLLNRPTDIALTFADYHGVANRNARTFADLLPETHRFIEQVERVSGAPVSLVSKAFSLDGVIDRVGWR